MKSQSKRFMNHMGKLYQINNVKKKDNKEEQEEPAVGFFELWRYANTREVLLCVCSVASAAASGLGLVAAVAVYAELCGLMLRRAAGAAGGDGGDVLVGGGEQYSLVIAAFGGARPVTESTRSAHMSALLQDCAAFVCASVVIVAVQWSLAAAAAGTAHHAADTMCRRLRVLLVRASLRQDISYFDTHPATDIATSLQEGVEKIRVALGAQLGVSAYLGSTAAWCAGAALLAGPRLAAAALALVPLCAAAAAAASQLQCVYSAREAAHSAAAASSAQEALAAAPTVRAYCAEDHETERYKSFLSAVTKWSVRRAAAAGGGTAAGWTLVFLLQALVIVYGASLALYRDYQPETIMQVLMYLAMTAQNLTLCQGHLEAFASARGAASSLYSLLRREPRVDPLSEEGHKPDHIKGDIVFDDVHFSYPSRPDVKVLNGFSLHIHAGETVALVGRSGSGKSTVLQLLLRLYEPARGTVTVDGRPLTSLNVQHFRRSIGVMSQDTSLFSGTIRENIAIGRPDLTDDDVIAAAKMAQAHDFIMKMPQGYDTLVSERGASLSGGQRARICAARAVRGAGGQGGALLLLDEPTAALDAHTERQVQAALDEASKGRTTLVVSHRLSQLRCASRVVFVCGGRVLEAGAPHELLARRGAYWRLLQGDRNRQTSIPKSPSLLPEEDSELEPTKKQDDLVRSIVRQSMRKEALVRSSIRSSVRGLQPPPPPVTSVEDDVDDDDEEPPPPAPLRALFALGPAGRRRAAAGCACAALVGASLPVFSLLFARFFALFGTSPPAAVWSAAQLTGGMFALVALAAGALTVLQARWLPAAHAMNVAKLRARLFRHYLAQDQSFFDLRSHSVGALASRLSGDCARVFDATGMHLGSVVQGCSTLLVAVVMSTVYSWKMTLVSALSIPLVVGGVWLEGGAASRGAGGAGGAAAAVEAVLNVRIVHTLGIQETMIARYKNALYATKGPPSLVRGVVYGLCVAAPTVGFTVALGVGCWLLVHEDLSYQHVIFISEALMYGAWMVAESLSFAPGVWAARAAAARVLRDLAVTPGVTDPANVDPALADDGDAGESREPRGSIRFESVTFSYGGKKGSGGVRGVSAGVRAGGSLALVGGSGAGKSSLLRLLLRDYDPHAGALYLDGTDIRRLPLRRLRRSLALVAQDAAVFARSLRDNIAYGDLARDVPIGDVIDAAKQADIHDFIQALPQGYDTVVSRSSLSGGQRARVGVARALVRRGAVLLLDEPTAALDHDAEQAVSASLEAAVRGAGGRGGRGALLVAHRLATAAFADNIALMQQGEIVEMGTHKELIARQGQYWQLWRTQNGAEDTQDAGDVAIKDAGDDSNTGGS